MYRTKNETFYTMDVEIYKLEGVGTTLLLSPSFNHKSPLTLTHQYTSPPSRLTYDPLGLYKRKNRQKRWGKEKGGTVVVCSVLILITPFVVNRLIQSPHNGSPGRRSTPQRPSYK